MPLKLIQIAKGAIGHWLPKGRFFRSVALLGGTTVMTQGLAICLSPLYSRLYSPHHYGVFGQFYAIVSSALTVGGFCFELAIPTAEKDEDALSLVILALSCVTFIALASFGWTALDVWQFNQNPGVGHKLYLLIVPVAVMLSGLYRVVQYWAIREQAFKAIAKATVKQTVGGQAVTLGFGLLHPSPLGLILGKIVSWSAGAGSLSQTTRLFKLLKAHRLSVGVSNLWEVAKKHRQYALMQCPSTVLNAIGLYLPGVLMLPYYGAEFAGQFNLAQQVTRVPVSLVGSSLSQVFFSEAASISRSDPRQLRRLFGSISRKLALASLLVLLPCLVAPFILPILFGRRWQDAGHLTMWLGLGMAMQFWVSPLSNIPNVVGRLRGQLMIDASRALLVFAAIYIPHRFAFNPMMAVIYYSLVLAANYVACYALYRHQIITHSRCSVQRNVRESPASAAQILLNES